MKGACLAGIALVIGLIAVGCPINFGQITVKLLPYDVTQPNDQGEWAQWRLDGGEWQNSNVVDLNVPTGTHTISYKELDGWTTPADQTIEILTNGWSVTQGVTVESFKKAVVGTYAEAPTTGSVVVTIGPNDAVAAGGLWQLDGGKWYNSGSKAEEVQPGEHVVSFASITTGWTTPSDQTVAVTAGQTTVLTGTYVLNQTTRALTVTIIPPEAVAAGAQWSLDGASWMNPAITLTGLTLGKHVVSFKNVLDFTTPANVTVTISDNLTAVAIGTYIFQTFGNVSVVLKPDEVTYYGAQWKLDNGALQNTDVTLFGVPSGPHTITFSPIAGWVTPLAQVIDIQQDQTVIVTGTYVQNVTTGGIVVTILPPTAAAAGAQWRIDGGAWQLSGSTVVSLQPGIHTVSFNTIPGWITPTDQTVAVTIGIITTTSGSYLPNSKSGNP